MAKKTSPRYESASVAREREHAQRQNAAIQISIANRNADDIRGIRGIMQLIVELKSSGLNYREIGEEVGDDLAELDISIPPKHLGNAIGAAYRAELKDADGVNELIYTIDSSPTLKRKLIDAVEDRAGYGVLVDPELKQMLIDAGLLSTQKAEDDPEGRRLFRIALMSVHNRWMAWHIARGNI